MWVWEKAKESELGLRRGRPAIGSRPEAGQKSEVQIWQGGSLLSMEPCAAPQSKGFLAFLYRFQARPGQTGPSHGSGQSKQTPGFLRPTLTPEMDSKIFVAARVVRIPRDGAQVHRQRFAEARLIIKRQRPLPPSVGEKWPFADRLIEIRGGTAMP